MAAGNWPLASAQTPDVAKENKTQRSLAGCAAWAVDPGCHELQEALQLFVPTLGE